MSCCSSHTEEPLLPFVASSLILPPKLTHKISVLGDSGSGKTTLIYRLIHNKMLDTSQPTNGCGYDDHVIVRDGVNVPCQIWDTAGQEKFEALVPVYIRGTDLCLIVLCSTRSTSENAASLNKWKKLLYEVAPDSQMLVVISRCDLIDCVDTEEVHKIRTSSLTGEGIQHLIDEVVRRLNRTML